MSILSPHPCDAIFILGTSLNLTHLSKVQHVSVCEIFLDCNHSFSLTCYFLCSSILYCTSSTWLWNLYLITYHIKFSILLYILFSPNCFRSCQPDHNLFLLLAFYEKCYDLFHKLKEIFEPREKKSEGKLKVFKFRTMVFLFHWCWKQCVFL